MKIKTAVFGANGLLGGELLRLLHHHASFEVELAISRSAADQPVASVHPSTRGHGPVTFRKASPRDAAASCQLAFLATPADASARLASELVEAGIETVVDLSPSYRLRDAEVHAHWYPDAGRDEALAEEAVYGLPEVNRGALRGARMIAAPGCFATATALALLPLSTLDSVRPSQIAVDGKTASTGSGNRLRAGGMHPLRANVVSPYAPSGHRHVPEVKQTLAQAGVTNGQPLRLGMSAYGVDAVRGLLSSSYLFVEDGLEPAQVRRAIHSTFRGEPFVRGVTATAGITPLPDPKALTGSNFCDVGGFYDEDEGRLVLMAALDNMIKGGAGQAVQAANVRYGLDERDGLRSLPLYP